MKVVSRLVIEKVDLCKVAHDATLEKAIVRAEAAAARAWVGTADVRRALEDQEHDKERLMAVATVATLPT